MVSPCDCRFLQATPLLPVGCVMSKLHVHKADRDPRRPLVALLSLSQGHQPPSGAPGAWLVRSHTSRAAPQHEPLLGRALWGTPAHDPLASLPQT